MEPQKPSIGRIVHYNTESGPNAALVVGVNEGGTVNLSSCNAGGTWSSRTTVSEGTEAGTWMWPPRA